MPIDYIFVLSMQSYILYVDARLLYVHYSVECQSNHTRMQLITAYMSFSQSMLTFGTIIRTPSGLVKEDVLDKI
jgi:hypothetical protein